MPLWEIFGLTTVALSLIFLILTGLRSPATLLFIAIGTSSLINFSFFLGEVSSRIALPDLLFLVLLSTWFIRKALRSSSPLFFPRWSGLLLLMLLYAMVLSFLSPPWSRNVLLGEGQFFAVLFGMLTFLLIVLTVDPSDNLEGYLKAWLISALFASTVALIDMGDLFSNNNTAAYDANGFFGIHDLGSFIGNDFTKSILSSFSFRIQGSFRTPGQLAAYSLTTFMAMFAYSFHPAPKKPLRIFLRVLSFFLILCMLATTRSSVILSLGLSTLFFLRYFLFRNRRIRLKPALICSGIAIALLALLSMMSPTIYYNLVERNLKEYQNLFHGNGFFANQLMLVKQAFMDNPLIGMGFGRFISSQYHEYVRAYEIHSTLFQFIGETGIIGTLAYLCFIAYFARISFLAYRNCANTKWQHFSALLFWGFLSMIPSYLYNRHLRERTFWFFIALLYLVYLHSKTIRNNSSEALKP